MSECRRTSIGQGPLGREFFRRLVPDRARNRAPVLAFYNFVRAADDVADNAAAAADEKLGLLELMRASLWAKATLFRKA